MELILMKIRIFQNNKFSNLKYNDTIKEYTNIIKSNSNKSYKNNQSNCIQNKIKK